ncbi:MAG: hypothetical protein HY308_02275 [Gammaproteobacteria bacterium]|nr:hypothetical protein [Gammaproteobacteria bacterium]
MVTSEDILIERSHFEQIGVENTKLDLWRGVHLKDDRPNPLYPDLEDRTLSHGGTREADIKPRFDAEFDEWCVDLEFDKKGRPKGTSLADREGIFGHKNWKYFFIPGGTSIPDELIITKDGSLEGKNCTHYTIAPKYRMPKWTFLKALDQLKMNAEIQLRQMKGMGHG